MVRKIRATLTQGFSSEREGSTVGDLGGSRPSKDARRRTRWLRLAIVTALVAVGGFVTATVGMSMVFGAQAIGTGETTTDQSSSDLSVEATGPSYARQGADYVVQLTVSNAGP